MEATSALKLTEKEGQKKEGFSRKNFFLPPSFCQLGLVNGTRAKS
jgi:hypothetical protein